MSCVFQASVQYPHCSAALDIIADAPVGVIVMRLASQSATAVLTTIRHAISVRLHTLNSNHSSRKSKSILKSKKKTHHFNVIEANSISSSSSLPSSAHSQPSSPSPPSSSTTLPPSTWSTAHSPTLPSSSSRLPVTLPSQTSVPSSSSEPPTSPTPLSPIETLSGDLLNYFSNSFIRLYPTLYMYCKPVSACFFM